MKRGNCSCMLEPYLIEHCAPTLASLKTASLFRFPCDSKAQLNAEVAQCGACLAGRGISIAVLKLTAQGALIYVYREKKLEADLHKPGAAALLREKGYPDQTPAGALAWLRRRMEMSGEFPHEIGLFLGYPLEDVQGFIRHGGKGAKCCGSWKVYGDQQAAMAQFAKFRKCRHVYRRLWREGKRDILQLTVAA